MDLQTFINEWKGKKIDVDNVNQNQCVDLCKEWLKELGYANYNLPYNAKDWDKNASSELVWTKNTPSGVPQAGDIIVWDAWTYGHVAIFIHGDSNNFETFDQNWTGKLDPCGLITHTYYGVKGWLRPTKGATMANWVKYVNINGTGAIALEVNNGNEMVNVPIKNPNYVPWEGTTIPAVEKRAVQGASLIKPSECPSCPVCPPPTVCPTCPPSDCSALQKALDAEVEKVRLNEITIENQKEEFEALNTEKDKLTKELNDCQNFVCPPSETLAKTGVSDLIKELLRRLIFWSK
jgi:hypothetical protein